MGVLMFPSEMEDYFEIRFPFAPRVCTTPLLSEERLKKRRRKMDQFILS